LAALLKILTYLGLPKAELYAQSGIEDYWVLDVNNRQLHVFSSLDQNGYQSKAILAEEAKLSPLKFPNLMIAVQDMLPPMIIQ
jgi:Uma2 family endonuclease